MAEPNIHLILHNTLAVMSVIVMVCLIIFLLANNIRKTVNVTLSLTALAVIAFELTHVFGVSATDSNLSRLILMGNISVIFLSAFNFHCVLAVLNKDKRKMWLIWLVYAAGIFLSFFYLLFPDAFILTSVPKMYFPNYYVAGNYYWIELLVFHNLVPLYFIYELIHSYTKSIDKKERNRILYFAVALGLGWTFGQAPNFLIFNLPVDPMYGIYFPILFCVPFTYAVLNHDLLDIRIVAKRAFYYGILVAICAAILIFMNFLNKWVEEIIPNIPIYVVPVISSVFAVAVGIAVWRKVREGDTLKYDFINKTMHELRTPLTHIKIASENLEQSKLDENQKSSLDYIGKANDKLIELTDLVKEKVE